jgi:hypothetical protein
MTITMLHPAGTTILTVTQTAGTAVLYDDEAYCTEASSDVDWNTDYITYIISPARPIPEKSKPVRRRPLREEKQDVFYLMPRVQKPIFHRKILRCNRKGMGLRIRKSTK